MGRYSLKEKLNPEELYNQFLSLDEQQRLFATIGSVLLLLLLVFVPVTCAGSKISKLQKNIFNHEKNMDELSSKLREYQLVDSQLKAIKSQWEGRGKIPLSTTLESLSAQSGLDKNIDAIKEQPSSGSEGLVEENIAAVRVSRVSMQQAIDYLYKIESFQRGVLKVKKLQIKPRYDNRQQFDLNFDVSTYTLKAPKSDEKEGGNK
ncbi:MAG: hypothetical protein HQM15_08220 [Deltaproteobacteria bacterium]|nr:hypothetical protein [Deltaproteobacteria bacterium]